MADWWSTNILDLQEVGSSGGDKGCNFAGFPCAKNFKMGYTAPRKVYGQSLYNRSCVSVIFVGCIRPPIFLRGCEDAFCKVLIQDTGELYGDRKALKRHHRITMLAEPAFIKFTYDLMTMDLRNRSAVYEPIRLRPISLMSPGIDIDGDPLVADESEGMRETQISLSDGDITEQPQPYGEFEPPNTFSTQNSASSSTREFPTTPIEHKARRFILSFILSVSGVSILIFSIFYSHFALVSETTKHSNIALAPGKTVLVINMLSHIVAMFCQLLFSNASEALRWALACSNEGVQLTTFLGLSRATPFIGVLYLSFRRGSHQVWSLLRYF
jgi:hypothetical protein